MQGLCQPGKDDLDGKVPFQHVREKMLEFFGSQVDHQEFHKAFIFILDAGGADSPHLKDLNSFTAVFVNPKKRKMRFEAYGVVVTYPLEFPRIKVACLKWA